MANREIKLGENSTYNESNIPENSALVTIPIDKTQLEKVYNNFLNEAITPYLKPYGDILIQQCKEAISKVVNQNIIERVKSEVQFENRKWHFDNIRKLLNDELKKNKKKENNFSKSEAINRVILIQEWIDKIGDISKDEIDLTAIWEGWLIEFEKNKKINDEKRALYIMKELSAEEAVLMLDINTNLKLNSVENKNTYLLNELIKKDLVTEVKETKGRITTHINISIFITAVTFYLFFWFTDFLPKKLSSLLESPIPIIILGGGMFFLYWQRESTAKYELTWLGEKIVSYHNSTKKKEKEYQNKYK